MSLTKVISDMVTYTSAGIGGTTRAIKQIFQQFSSDFEGGPSTEPAYAAISVNKTRTTINRHAFEDWSVLNTTDTNLGYASFDARPEMVNSLPQDHLVGFQSRPIFSGSANLTGYFDCINAFPTINGPGTVTNYHGVRIRDPLGTGTIQNNVGILIEPVLRGNFNWAIYSQGGDSHFDGKIECFGIESSNPNGSLGVNFGPDVSGKEIVYGYNVVPGTPANYGIHTFYDGKNNIIGQFGVGGFLIQTKLYSNQAQRPGVYTFATLPVGTNGEIIYVSNGRKVGEGAGAGTGVMAYFSNGGWRVFSTDAVVTA